MHTYKWLAIETSTDMLSLAIASTLGDSSEVWTHTSQGGAKSSQLVLPEIVRLMEEAQIRFTDLTAVVFGKGPGSFTGLRTACSVAQGLAFGAGVPVLPIDTLLAVAAAAGNLDLASLLIARRARINNRHDAPRQILRPNPRRPQRRPHRRIRPPPQRNRHRRRVAHRPVMKHQPGPQPEQRRARILLQPAFRQPRREPPRLHPPHQWIKHRIQHRQRVGAVGAVLRINQFNPGLSNSEHDHTPGTPP